MFVLCAIRSGTSRRLRGSLGMALGCSMLSYYEDVFFIAVLAGE